MALSEEERRLLAGLERRLQREDPQLARRLALLRVTTPGRGPGWSALAASLTLLLVNAGVLLLGMSWHSSALLGLAVLTFPTVMLPAARSAGRRR